MDQPHELTSCFNKLPLTSINNIPKDKNMYTLQSPVECQKKNYVFKVQLVEIPV